MVTKVSVGSPGSRTLFRRRRCPFALENVRHVGGQFRRMIGLAPRWSGCNGACGGIPPNSCGMSCRLAAFPPRGWPMSNHVGLQGANGLSDRARRLTQGHALPDRKAQPPVSTPARPTQPIASDWTTGMTLGCCRVFLAFRRDQPFPTAFAQEESEVLSRPAA
jgi:hypothetical protein